MMRLDYSQFTDPDIESRILTAMMQSEEQRVKLLATLKWEEFSDPFNRVAFRTIKKNHEKGLPIDSRRLSQQTGLNGLGALERLQEIEFGFVLPHEVDNFVTHIQSLAAKREVRKATIAAANALVNRAPEAAEALDVLETQIKNSKQIEVPDDFHVREWPTLHDDALLGLVGRIVRASVESSEADPAAVLATLLVRAGATFGRHAWTKIGDDRHYPLVFGMVVGASANARKGTSLGPVERIFEDAESRLGAPELRVTNGLSSGEGLIAAIRDAKKATKDEDEDEGVSDKRLLVIESEFAGPLKAMQRQGNTLSVVIRDAWDRRKLSIMTKNSPLTASDGHIAMLGHITKHELTRLLEKVEMSNGLVNRFLWFCSRRSKILAFPEGLDEMVIPSLASDLAAAIRHGQKDQLMNFDSQAADYYRELYYRVTTQEAGGIVGDITARGPAQIRRLALIYALLERDDMIRIDHLKAAEAVWNYCLASSKWIFGSPTSGGNSPAETLNERILQALRSGEKTQTELAQKFKNTTKAGQLATALSELQAIGRISQVKGVSTGGRAPIVWRLTEVR